MLGKKENFFNCELPSESQKKTKIKEMKGVQGRFEFTLRPGCTDPSTILMAQKCLVIVYLQRNTPYFNKLLNLCEIYFSDTKDRYAQGHSSSVSHSPCSFLSTRVYFHLLPFPGSLRSSCSTTLGMMMTTRKFSRAMGSCRSVTFCPSS